LDTACKEIAAACVVMSERSVDFCHMHGVITQTKGIFVTTMRTTDFTTFWRNVNDRKPKRFTRCKYRCTKILGR
jgi:hypothetical protein